MEIIEEQLIELALLLIRKAKIEEKLRQTFKCLLRRLFSCCGMKNIENELQFLNESISELTNPMVKTTMVKTTMVKTTLV
tara:strand:+ start:264 stop:503 length:240 start_codon:yes stop_codon:yes gene_type:complete